MEQSLTDLGFIKKPTPTAPKSQSEMSASLLWYFVAFKLYEIAIAQRHCRAQFPLLAFVESKPVVIFKQ